jgi:hypothetical protein
MKEMDYEKAARELPANLAVELKQSPLYANSPISADALEEQFRESLNLLIQLEAKGSSRESEMRAKESDSQISRKAAKVAHPDAPDEFLGLLYPSSEFAKARSLESEFDFLLHPGAGPKKTASAFPELDALLK